jgi:hypothetical protein
MMREGEISHEDHDHNLYGLKLLFWMGLAFSVAAYMILFRWKHSDYEKRDASRAATYGCLPLTLFILGSIYAIATQPWPYLIGFGAPFFGMFLLWALTREPMAADGESSPEVVAEA